MMKFAAGLVFAGALLGFSANANAQTPPEIQKDTKVVASTETPAPMIAPLGVGTAFNASLDEALDTRHAKAGDAVAAEAAEDVSYQRQRDFPEGDEDRGARGESDLGRQGAYRISDFRAVRQGGDEGRPRDHFQRRNSGAGGYRGDPPESAKSSVSEAQAVPWRNDSDVGSDTLVLTTNISSRKRWRLRWRRRCGAGRFNSDGLFSSDSKGAFGRPDLKMYTPTSEGSHGTVILSSKKTLHLDPGTHLLLVVQPPPSESGWRGGECA